MSTNELQQQTTVNVQEKANLIWAIADKLVGVYKPHEYGNVILPMCVIKRFEDTLAPTREKVLETNKELEENNNVDEFGSLFYRTFTQLLRTNEKLFRTTPDPYLDPRVKAVFGND